MPSMVAVAARSIATNSKQGRDIQAPENSPPPSSIDEFEGDPKKEDDGVGDPEALGEYEDEYEDEEEGEGEVPKLVALGRDTLVALSIDSWISMG
jgi:hypothetical protein